MALHDQEAGHDRSGEEKQGGLWTQDKLAALREAIKENHGSGGGRERLTAVERGASSSLPHETGGWRTWQAELREAMQQPSRSDSVERGRMGAEGPVVSQDPPPYPSPSEDRILEEGTQSGNEGTSGFGGESAPASLPLTRVGRDTELVNQERPYTMGTMTWENCEGEEGPPLGTDMSSWYQERPSSSNSRPGAAARRGTSGGTPATHRREELALLDETRRRTVRFLGRGKVRTPHW